MSQVQYCPVRLSRLLLWVQMCGLDAQSEWANWCRRNDLCWQEDVGKYLKGAVFHLTQRKGFRDAGDPKDNSSEL